MEIRKYDCENRVEYSKFIRKYNKSKYLSSLNIQTFYKGKKIYLIVEKLFFNRYKIIGYSIIYEELHALCFWEKISAKYEGDTNTIYISDFMVDNIYQKQGVGKFFAKYIIENLYKDKDIILNPDGDGNWFWKKFGFIPDNISKNLTLVLKRKVKI